MEKGKVQSILSRPAPLWLELAVLVVGLLLMRGISAASHDDLQVLLFYHYGHSFWIGNPPFHILPAEYPPLSLLLFTLTVLPPLANPIRSVLVYTIWMAILAFVSYFIFKRFTDERRARLYALAVFIGTGSVLLISYDLAPAFATLGALWAVQRRRFTLAYVFLAIGILLKLYPVFLLPVVIIEQISALSGTEQAGPRFRAFFAGRVLPNVLRGLGVCIAIVALVFAGALLINGNGALSEFQFASQRPLQFESTPASLLWISHFFGVPVQLQYSFGAFNWVSPQDGPFKLLSTVLLIAGCLWVYWRQLAGKLTFQHAFLASLCVVVATNKVLSPQYFIWLLPVAVAVDCFDGIWLLICLLTLLEYPLIQPLRHQLSQDAYYTVIDLIVIVRNALLIFVTLHLILRPPVSDETAAYSAQTAPPADQVNATTLPGV